MKRLILKAISFRFLFITTENIQTKSLIVIITYKSILHWFQDLDCPIGLRLMNIRKLELEVKRYLK